MAKKKNTGRSMVVVIGCSRLGASIASENSMNGVYTTIIDTNQNAFKKLDSSYSGYSIIGNAEEASVLKKGHIEEAKEVDVTTGDDDTNIYLACIMAEIYHIPSVIVRLRDESKAVLLTNPCIHVISPSSLSVQAYRAIRDQAEKDIDAAKEDR
jgi:trk system potassium uptake protein TrkA